MTATASRENLFDQASVPRLPSARSAAQGNNWALVGLATYRMLTGQVPAKARVDDDASFDRHVFASILAVAASEGNVLPERAGLAADDLATLIGRWFPGASNALPAWTSHSPRVDDDEIVMVRDLLLEHRSSDGDDGRWLAAMVARRAMEPNHLWEDLGLRERSELTRLLLRHFAPIAARNTKNMRWKRFFYRALCERDGLVMCSTPVCTQCGDFGLCFGEESGESRLAHGRRTMALKLASSSDPNPAAFGSSSMMVLP